MTESSNFLPTQKYKLADRPKWWLPTFFKVVVIALGLMGLIAYFASLLLYAQAETLYGDSDEWDESREVLMGGVMDDTASLALEAIFVVAFLWLLAIGLDKLDQLVWLNATDQDREEILAKRKKKNAKNK